MMKDHPFAVAVVHSTTPRLVHFSMSGELMQWEKAGRARSGATEGN